MTINCVKQKAFEGVPPPLPPPPSSPSAAHGNLAHNTREQFGTKSFSPKIILLYFLLHNIFVFPTINKKMIRKKLQNCVEWTRTAQNSSHTINHFPSSSSSSLAVAGPRAWHRSCGGHVSVADGLIFRI